MVPAFKLFTATAQNQLGLHSIKYKLTLINLMVYMGISLLVYKSSGVQLVLKSQLYPKSVRKELNKTYFKVTILKKQNQVLKTNPYNIPPKKREVTLCKCNNWKCKQTKNLAAAASRDIANSIGQVLENNLTRRQYAFMR